MRGKRGHLCRGRGPTFRAHCHRCGCVPPSRTNCPILPSLSVLDPLSQIIHCCLGTPGLTRLLRNPHPHSSDRRGRSQLCPQQDAPLPLLLGDTGQRASRRSCSLSPDMRPYCGLGNKSTSEDSLGKRPSLQRET